MIDLGAVAGHPALEGFDFEPDVVTDRVGVRCARQGCAYSTWMGSEVIRDTGGKVLVMICGKHNHKMHGPAATSIHLDEMLVAAGPLFDVTAGADGCVTVICRLCGTMVDKAANLTPPYLVRRLTGRHINSHLPEHLQPPSVAGGQRARNIGGHRVVVRDATATHSLDSDGSMYAVVCDCGEIWLCDVGDLSTVERKVKEHVLLRTLAAKPKPRQKPEPPVGMLDLIVRLDDEEIA